jgi:tRNA A-37 threonylcarbamoyl transferase component Bud32
VRLPWLRPPLEEILKDADAFLAAPAHLLKQGRSATVGRAHGVVLKRFNLRKRGNLLKDLFRRSRALRAFQKAYHLELVGIATARPIAAGEERTLGLVTRSYLVMEEIPGAKLSHQLSGRNQAAGRAAAELIARLHEEGFSHRDLKTTNIVFDGSGRPHLLDLEGLRFIGQVADQRAALDLARLAAGALQWVNDLSRTQRLRFLKRYCQCRGRNNWQWWWRTIARMIT